MGLGNLCSSPVDGGSRGRTPESTVLCASQLDIRLGHRGLNGGNRYAPRGQNEYILKHHNTVSNNRSDIRPLLDDVVHRLRRADLVPILIQIRLLPITSAVTPSTLHALPGDVEPHLNELVRDTRCRVPGIGDVWWEGGELERDLVLARDVGVGDLG